ncbi:hypothetical protein BaRGS_00031395 [Batillaria attramentaria]|uniref:CCHC-type domain-containing protein n=1 Tax=Batillaria attramentaria TaxID=370345 RepID=A0ABD0JRM7_9CAEN
MTPPATPNPDSDSSTKATETSATGVQTCLCYYFHEPGHLVKACPKKKQANTRSETVLFTRSPEDDPIRQSFACVMEGRVVDAIRDSGATTVFVEAPRGPARRIVTLSGEMGRKYPTVVVDMSTPYFKGRVWAVAVQSPPFSLLIGNRVTMEDGEVCDISTDLPTRVLAGVTTRAEAKRKLLQTTLDPLAPGIKEQVTPETLKTLQRSDPTLSQVRRLAGAPARLNMGL